MRVPALSVMAAALALGACAGTPATDPAQIAAIKATIHRDFALTCPAADPDFVFWSYEAEAMKPSEFVPGGLIYLPARYRRALGSPAMQSRVSHEIAHTCGADEKTARAVSRVWAGR